MIFPAGPHETHGMEDARFVRFTDDDGAVTYYATYTAFDGFEIVPQLIQTDDFASLPHRHAQRRRRAKQGHGAVPAADRREVRDAVAHAIARTSTWRPRPTSGTGPTSRELHRPQPSWELLQIGNCGSPIETEAGWLVHHPRRRADAAVRASARCCWTSTIRGG